MSMWKTIPTLFGDLADRPDAADVPYGTGWVDENEELSISDGTVWTVVAGGGNPVAVDDDGVEVVADVTRLNFGDNLAVTDDGSGEVTIDVDGDGVVCGTDTIPDTETDVDVAHGGGGNVPTTVVVTAREVEPLGVTGRDGTTFTVARAGSSGDLGFDWIACGFGEAPFDPDSIADLSIWQDASQLSGFSDNDPVQTWPDLSANSFDMTQGTASIAPLYRTSVFGSLPGLEFGSSGGQGSRRMSISGGHPLGSSASFTEFIVFHPTIWGGSNPGLWRDGSGSSGNSFHIFQSNTGRPWVRWNGSDILQPGSGYAVSLDVPTIITLRMDNASSVEWYADGELRHSASHAQSASPTLFNFFWQNSSSERPVAYFGERLVYLRALTPSERGDVESYLSDKWGIPMA